MYTQARSHSNRLLLEKPERAEMFMYPDRLEAPIAPIYSIRRSCSGKVFPMHSNPASHEVRLGVNSLRVRASSSRYRLRKFKIIPHLCRHFHRFLQTSSQAWTCILAGTIFYSDKSPGSEASLVLAREIASRATPPRTGSQAQRRRSALYARKRVSRHGERTPRPPAHRRVAFQIRVQIRA